MKIAKKKINFLQTYSQITVAIVSQSVPPDDITAEAPKPPLQMQVLVHLISVLVH